MSSLSGKGSSHAVELSLLRADITPEQLRIICDAALTEGLAGILVPSSLTSFAVDFLEGSDVQALAQIGFPFGNVHSDVKRYEVEVALDEGAQGFEVLLNPAHIAAGRYDAALRELRDVVEAADERLVRATVRWQALNKLQRQSVASLVADSGAHYFSTGLGLGDLADTAESLAELRELLSPKFLVKAACAGSGNIEESLMAAGAVRVGRVATL